jgi:hypothetical protein
LILKKEKQNHLDNTQSTRMIVGIHKKKGDYFL